MLPKIILMFSSFEMCGFWVKAALSSTMIEYFSFCIVCVLSSLCNSSLDPDFQDQVKNKCLIFFEQKKLYSYNLYIAWSLKG